MTVNKSYFGANNQALTCTLTSLANAGQRASAALVQTSDLSLDIGVFLKIKTGASGVVSYGQVNIYAYGSCDGGTTYTDGVAGTDGSVTMTVPPNAKLIGVMNCVANATTYYAGPFMIASAFNGVLPDHCGIIVQNLTGGTLDASVASAFYQEFFSQAV
jgi:hypothetical protein